MNKRALKKFKEIIESKPQDAKVFLGKNKERKELGSMNIEELLNNVMEWGEQSSQGLRCGILGCDVDVTNRCMHCRGGYCTEHIKMHFHTADNDGVIIKNE